MSKSGKMRALIFMIWLLPVAAQAETKNAAIPQIEVQTVDVSVPDTLLAQLTSQPEKQPVADSQKNDREKTRGPATSVACDGCRKSIAGIFGF